MESGAQYVVAAYAVVLAGLVLYLVVIGMRLARLARETELVARLLDEDRHAGREGIDPAPDRPEEEAVGARPLASRPARAPEGG